MALLGFVIGAGAFFAPCAFVMFPAYVTYYVSLGGGGLRHGFGHGLASTRLERPAAPDWANPQKISLLAR